MTPQEINVIIAEWCEPKPPYTHSSEQSFLWADPPRSPRGFWRCVYIYNHGDVPEWVPTLLSSDLNEMARALKVVRERGLDVSFSKALLDVLNMAPPETHCELVMVATATATQRARALVRVIQGER